jgi:hypothetical protein
VGRGGKGIEPVARLSFGRGARCQKARAQSSSDSRSPKGSAGPSCFAGQARCSCCNLPLFLRLRALRPLPWWPLLLDAAGETAALSLFARRCLFLFAVRSALSLVSLSALSRVTAPRAALSSCTPHAPCCCMPPRLLDVPVPEHCVLLRHCSLPHAPRALHLPTHHARHAHWLRNSLCDALDAASVCSCCSLDSAALAALAALALLSACSRSTQASQLQVHLRLELLLFWLLLHLILHQQPSVCRGALLRCGFVAVAFVFAAVHRRNVLLASFLHFFLHFLCMRTGQVVSVPARAMRRCVVCDSVCRQASGPAVPQARPYP